MILPMQNRHDYLVIGAGAAGLQLGYFFKKSGYDYKIIEAEPVVGSFWLKYPRHRKMISINKVNNGYTDKDALLRWDWNSLICDDENIKFSKYTKRYFPNADTYQKYLHDFYNHFDLNVDFNCQVENIKKENGIFHVVCENGESYEAKRLIISTGFNKLYTPSIPGIELVESYADFSFDPDDYEGQTVLIIGKGTSAFETANHLIETTRVIHMASPESIRLAWATHYVGHLRAINTEFLDTYLLKGQNSVLDAKVDNIRRVGNEYLVDFIYPNADDQRMTIAYDRVLSCTGFQFDSTIFSDECKPDLLPSGKLPCMTNAWESSNVDNLFFAGTLMQALDHQKTHSNVIHGFRFNIRALHKYFGERFHGEPLPCKQFNLSDIKLARHVIKRISTDAAMFQQQGFLGDVIVFSHEDKCAHYYEGLPVAYVNSKRFSDHDWYYVVTMEFGHSDQDPFSIAREKDPEKANEDFYLHPRLTRYTKGKKEYEYHIPEHLENDWRATEFPGHSPLLRSVEYVGQKDHSMFQRSYLENLSRFLEDEFEKFKIQVHTDSEFNEAHSEVAE